MYKDFNINLFIFEFLKYSSRLYIIILCSILSILRCTLLLLFYFCLFVNSTCDYKNNNEILWKRKNRFYIGNINIRLILLW